jgi:hypothetical protein
MFFFFNFNPISGVLLSSFVLDNHGASLLHHHDYTVMTERLLSRLMTPFNYPCVAFLPNWSNIQYMTGGFRCFIFIIPMFQVITTVLPAKITILPQLTSPRCGVV